VRIRDDATTLRAAPSVDPVSTCERPTLQRWAVVECSQDIGRWPAAIKLEPRRTDIPSMETTTYEISRGWVRLARWCGYLLALVAIAYLAGHLFAPHEISLGLASFGVVFFGGLALLSLRLGHTPEVYSVEISDDGVRRTSSGEWIPWAGVVALRERPILNRIDLIGPGGPTGINLEYQLDSFQEALDHVLDRVRLEMPRDSQSFQRPLFSPSRLLALASTIGLSALGAWVWMDEGGWTGPLLILMMLGTLVHDSVSQVSAVILSTDSLTIQRGFRTTTHPFSEITSLKLALRSIGNGYHYLDVFIETGGEQKPIRPAGSNPFQLFTTLRSSVGPAVG